MRKDKLKNIIYAVLVLGVMVALFAWPKLNDPNRSTVKAWNDAGIACLSGHSALSTGGQHIHPMLYISVDGVMEPMNGEIGVVKGCMAEIHVHDGQPNTLHVESILSSKKFKLVNWFVVYDKPLFREGYDLSAKVNGELYEENLAELILEDGQIIELEYSILE